ncbi:hypothetical protein HK102_002136 [Quaeritorhiza haematococci]|nr:hypothetical protein HK102_002136 [Quaeritorhiza haematococci]
MDALPVDIVLDVLRFLPLKDVWKLRRASSCLRDHVERFVESEVSLWFSRGKLIHYSNPNISNNSTDAGTNAENREQKQTSITVERWNLVPSVRCLTKTQYAEEEFHVRLNAPRALPPLSSQTEVSTPDGTTYKYVGVSSKTGRGFLTGDGFIFRAGVEANDDLGSILYGGGHSRRKCQAAPRIKIDPARDMISPKMWCTLDIVFDLQRERVASVVRGDVAGERNVDRNVWGHIAARETEGWVAGGGELDAVPRGEVAGNRNNNALTASKTTRVVKRMRYVVPSPTPEQLAMLHNQTTGHLAAKKHGTKRHRVRSGSATSGIRVNWTDGVAVLYRGVPSTLEPTVDEVHSSTRGRRAINNVSFANGEARRPKATPTPCDFSTKASTFTVGGAELVGEVHSPEEEYVEFRELRIPAERIFAIIEGILSLT